MSQHVVCHDYRGIPTMKSDYKFNSQNALMKDNCELSFLPVIAILLAIF